MKARIRRISASVDTAISFSSSASADATCSDRTCNDLNSSTEMPHGYNPSSKSLDICVPESRIDRMRKLLSSPLLRRRNASQHGPNCAGHSHGPQQHAPHCKHIVPSSSGGGSSSSSPSSSPALGSSSTSMKTFGVSLESLSNHQHPHHQHNNHPHYPEEYYVRDPEQIVVPHQKAAHILGQVCPGCLTSMPSNSSSTGSINDTATTTSSGHFSHHASSHADDYSMASSIGASPSSGTSSSSTTSSTSSTGGPNGSPCLIPFIVTRLCNFIENSGGITHEGLFRISGNAKLIEKLKQSFDITGDAPLETEGDLASAAALLKQFLRELPQPLIPNGLQFLDVIRSLKNDHDTCVLSLKALVSQLPDENYYTLRYLIRFLHRIAQRNDENRMTSSNLGIVFAPNIIRVCVDNLQSLKDQNLANEVINFLIIDFAEIFNENGEVGYPTGNQSTSREDLCSCESEPTCPYACHLEIAKNEIQQSSSIDGNLLLTIESAQKTANSLSILVSEHSGKVLDEERVSDDAIMELDRKRKDYKSKNHRTIDEFDDDRCQSFDCGLTVSATPKQHPQRCNSDGNSDELSPSTCSDPANLMLSTAEEHLRRQNAASNAHEIIITNSSDSVSTDDNTTTTATSTGATVCSVVTGQLTARGIRSNNERHPSSSDDNPEKSSSPNTSDIKLLCCENNVIFDSHMKTGRSGSCGSDCTENMNLPASLSFTSDDEEDSLSKSIASDCSGSSSSSSSSCSSESHMSADNEAGSSSSLNGENGGTTDNNQMGSKERHVAQQQQLNNHLLQHKPWQRSDDQQRPDGNSSPPQLSHRGQSALYEGTMFDFMNSSNSPGDFCLTVDTQMTVVCEEAPVSPSAYRGYLSTKLDETAYPPSPPVTTEAALYAVKHRNQQHHEYSTVAYESLDGRKTATTAAAPTAKIPGLKSRNKRLQSIRRKLRQFHTDFEQENGYRPSYDQKMASSFARPLMIELSSILSVSTKQLKDLDNGDPDETMILDEGGNNTCIDTRMDVDGLSNKARLSSNNWKYCSDMPPSAPLNSEDIFNTIFGNPKEKSLAKIEEMMNEIQRTLSEKRVVSSRPDSLDEMTSEQIFDEKLALQKALLRFEALYGRPNSKAERDIVRPVYDRYRMVKRYAARMIQKLGSKDPNSELQPILEHVQMDFKSPTHSRSSIDNNTNKPTTESEMLADKDDSTNEKLAIPNVEPPQPADASAPTVIPDCPTIVVCLNQKSTCDIAPPPPAATEIAKNFHEMSHEELLIHLREVRQQKRNLRSVLRTFENDFYKKTGRRVEKEDRCHMSSVYHSYKTTKGKIRLLEALVAKCARERNECQQNV